jgi:hypothetical protein
MESPLHCPHPVASKVSVAIACLFFGGGLVACGPDDSTEPHGASRDDTTSRVATTPEGLAAVGLTHVDPSIVSKVEGYTDESGGAMVSITLDHGPGDVLYLATRSSDFGLPSSSSCAQARKQAESPESRVVWCQRGPGSIAEVIGSTPGHRNQVIGTRVTAEGSVSAWIDPVSDRKDAIRLVRAQLADDRLGYLTSPEVIAMGDRLDQFEHIDVTASIELQTSDD